MKKNILQEIIKNGGATLDKNGSQITYKKGYQVSNKDIAIIDLKKLYAINQTIKKQLANLNKNEFLGLWVDDGKMYIDKSKHYTNKQKAINDGLTLNQLSIFNWSNKTCIYLKH